MIYDLSCLTPLSLLLLRIIVAIIFLASGIKHAQKPIERGKDIGMSPTATAVLGWIEIIAPLALMIGIYTQVAAVLLMLIMLGAMQKKIFVWKTKFFADKGYGWHYDLLLFLALFVILSTAGGLYVII